jgi:hypothetical protein
MKIKEKEKKATGKKSKSTGGWWRRNEVNKETERSLNVFLLNLLLHTYP